MEYIKPNFNESVQAYLHMNYRERMQHNELLFSQAQTKKELINLYYLFENCGVYLYQERLLIRIMALAQTQDDWEFLKFHGMYYYGVYQTAIENLKAYESVNGLFFLFEKLRKKIIYNNSFTIFHDAMKYFPKLIGKKVYLSPLNPDDAGIVTKWMNDMEITDNTHKSPKVFGLAQTKIRFEGIVTGDNYPFAIIKKDGDEFIGTTGLYKVNHINQTAELGIMIGDTQNHNKGYGEDTINTLLDFGFNTLNLYNIYLCVKSFNKKGIACYKKCGFKEIGTRHHCEYCNGERYDLIFMEILKPDWQKEKK